MNSKTSKTDIQLETVMKQKHVIAENFNRDTEMMKKKSKKRLKQLKLITYAHKWSNLLLDGREKELRAREAINETEKKKVDNEKTQKRQIELVISEQNKADERVLKLAEVHKREKEKLHQKIIELRKKLDEKQWLELVVKQMTEGLEMMKRMTDEHLETKNKMQSIQNDLEEKQAKLKDLEALNRALMVKERKSNDELVEARKELVSGLRENTSRAHIVVKRMGELESPFIAAAKRHCSGKEGHQNAIKSASLWGNQLENPSWNPFKVITVEGKSVELLDEEDEKIVR